MVSSKLRSVDYWTGYLGETDRWAVCDLFSILEVQKLSMRVARVRPGISLIE